MSLENGDYDGLLEVWLDAMLDKELNKKETK